MLWQWSRRQELSFPLPPGEYTLTLEGSGRNDQRGIRAYTQREVIPLRIVEGEQYLDLGEIELQPTRLATMFGQPAPELGPIKVWRNGSPVTMGQLRGQVVVLYFGGEHPRASGEISSLVELHDLFGDKGLTIISIYNCTSMQQMEQRWAGGYGRRLTSIADVPFRVVLDGDELTPAESPGRERSGATYGRYDISETATVLIDQAGRIVGEYPYKYTPDVIRRMLNLPEHNAEP